MSVTQLRAWWHRAAEWVRRRKVRRRRRKLVSAYATVGEVRYDLGPGFSPLMYAYDQLFNEGLLVVVESGDTRQIVWNWPDERDPDEVTPDDEAVVAAAEPLAGGETDA